MDVFKKTKNYCLTRFYNKKHEKIGYFVNKSLKIVKVDEN